MRITMKKLKSVARDNGILIVEAKGPIDKQLLGIHLLNPDTRELGNAIEIALKDGFDCIIFHTHKTWNYPINKKLKRDQLNTWLKQMKEFGSSKHAIERLEKLGVDISKCLDTMNARQIQTVLFLICASSNYAHELQRKWNREKKLT